MSPAPRVIISGAGIAGLAAAIRFARIGWQPTIVERAPARRREGYLINLAGDGLCAAERIGVLPALRSHGLDLRELTYFTPRGRHLFTVGNTAVQAFFGPDHLTLLRGEIEAILYHAARDRAEIRFGTHIRAVDQDPSGVHITLDDDTTLEAELLIGADGLHSGVRQLVFAADEVVRRDLGVLVAAFFPERVSAKVRERTVTTIAAPGRTVAMTRLGPDRAAAFFTYRSSDPAGQTAGGPRAALTRTYPGLDWLMPDLPAQLHGAEYIYFDTVAQVHLDRWTSGRVVLLGDAAWCLSLFAGAGAAMALTGADLLGTLVQQRADIPAALTASEAELRPEAERRQRSARRNAAHHSPPSRLHTWLGQLPVRLTALPFVTPLIRRRIHH